ncbi:glycolate oxidase subunit GlcE [Verticiella sediminum]|uniref:Glycolate oxidase subunit GlcE n=1 Tax=Verticiella sediminum TaxID=1247510 RepID=A0A556AFT7_9BURK|nr:glycolate oxidase subunit GlcE [Verticiella sediminum]TSH91756.1 glycolate oxidase subunit GlcE [Verticiella sediminum]
MDEYIKRIRAAAANGTALRIRGGGTKDFYGEPATGELLDTRGLAGIHAYEPSELVVTVGAGTLLRELQEHLAQQRQYLPFDPPHFGEGGTVGGMLAAGLSGPARASVGCVRDYVLGATLINGKGEHLHFGGQVMKNVAGYDISRVLAGSLGQLGLITAASLKVLPVPPADLTLRYACSEAEALQRLHAWGGQPLPLNASRWSDAQGGTLYVRLCGARAAVEAAQARMGGEALDAGKAQEGWAACRDHTLADFQPQAGEGLWRISVPQTAAVLAVPGAGPTIEWHGGLRWYRAPLDAAHALRSAARAVGGHATLFRVGAGAAAVPARFDAVADATSAIHRALRKAFDPAGIFNPGRMYAGL